MPCKDVAKWPRAPTSTQWRLISWKASVFNFDLADEFQVLLLLSLVCFLKPQVVFVGACQLDEREEPLPISLLDDDDIRAVTFPEVLWDMTRVVVWGVVAVEISPDPRPLTYDLLRVLLLGHQDHSLH